MDYHRRRPPLNRGECFAAPCTYNCLCLSACSSARTRIRRTQKITAVTVALTLKPYDSKKRHEHTAVIAPTHLSVYPFTGVFFPPGGTVPVTTVKCVQETSVAAIAIHARKVTTNRDATTERALRSAISTHASTYGSSWSIALEKPKRHRHPLQKTYTRASLSWRSDPYRRENGLVLQEQRTGLDICLRFGTITPRRG